MNIEKKLTPILKTCIFCLFILIGVVCLYSQDAPAPLGYIIWAIEGPVFSEPGAMGEIEDGDSVELISVAQSYVTNSGLDLSDVQFTLVMEKDGSELASHTFAMESFAGSNIWLVADPEMTDPNGSFTGAFIEALIDLGAGRHELKIKLFASHGGSKRLINEGMLAYTGEKGMMMYKLLLPKFADMDAAREGAVKAYQEEAAKQAAAEDAERRAANYFNITVENTNTGQTIYIIVKNLRTLSEDIREVPPGRKLPIELSRSGSYELLSYRQNTSKDYAESIADVDESSEGVIFSVR